MLIAMKLTDIVCSTKERGRKLNYCVILEKGQSYD